MVGNVLDFLIAFLIGSLVATGELISRYRDDPFRAIRSLPASFYIGINGLASTVALVLIRAFGWTFNIAEPTAIGLTQVLVAGFGAVALFRTSLFNVTVENQVVGIGPSVVLNVILSAADRAVDRKLAMRRSQRISEIMKDVSFSGAAQPLELFCLELMQNAQPADRLAVTAAIGSLNNAANSNVPDPVKSYVLGLALLNIVGVSVLDDAVKRVRPHIAPPPGGAPETT